MPNIALLNPTTKGLESSFVKLRSSVITWGSLVSSNTNLSDKQDHQPAVTFNWSQISQDSTSSIQEQTESSRTTSPRVNRERGVSNTKRALLTNEHYTIEQKHNGQSLMFDSI